MKNVCWPIAGHYHVIPLCLTLTVAQRIPGCPSQSVQGRHSGTQWSAAPWTPCFCGAEGVQTHAHSLLARHKAAAAALVVLSHRTWL